MAFAFALHHQPVDVATKPGFGIPDIGFAALEDTGLVSVDHPLRDRRAAMFGIKARPNGRHDIGAEDPVRGAGRSASHTSEPQSQMLNSYCIFSLEKKKNNNRK